MTPDSVSTGRPTPGSPNIRDYVRFYYHQPDSITQRRRRGAGFPSVGGSTAIQAGVMPVSWSAPSMSTHTPPPTTHDPVPDVDADGGVELPEPDTVFGTLIAGNSRICQRCYRRLRRRESFPHEPGLKIGEVAAYVDYELPADAEDWHYADRQYFENVAMPDRLAQDNPPSETPHESAKLCQSCGTFATHRSPDTRSRDDAVAAAAGLSVTLEELDVHHDWLVLVATVSELKANPDTAGDDHQCFSEAVAAAIRAHPGPHPRPT